MSKSYVEIDFFQMEKRNSNASSKPSSPERAPSSFRGIQSVVSRINPLLLKTVMAAGAPGHARSSDNVGAWPTSSNPSSPSRTTSPPPLPVHNVPRCSLGPATDTAPMTIFYNGAVTVFEVPREKAEAIIRVAEMGVVGKPAERPEDSMHDGNQLEGDLPMARAKSLQRFLEKRKDRLTSASPYHRVPSGASRTRGSDPLAAGSSREMDGTTWGERMGRLVCRKAGI